MLKIEITTQAAKFLSQIIPKHGRQPGTKIQKLRLNPEPHDSIRLKDFEPLRRTNIGKLINNVPFFIKNSTYFLYIVFIIYN